jgi:osmotically-inducible protein OsmY
LPDERIESTVSQGIVTLSGKVAYASQRDDAARTVRGLLRVRGVDNRITVDKPSVVPDNIREAIHTALERHAGREADRIDIEIDGSSVTLRGDVQSWPEREAVVGATRGTLGVDRVVDLMHIVA